MKDNSKYIKLAKYFKRNWLNSNFIEFDSIIDEQIKKRRQNNMF